MKKTMKLVATVWEYTNKAGEKKKEYLEVGKLFINDEGKQSIKLTNIPLGWDWWANAYEYEKKEQTTKVSDLPF